ncbi:MAG: membrane protein insertase YidC [Pseudomonadales bacterium]
MDFVRYPLIAAMLLVGVMLLMRWQEFDKAPVATPAANVQQPQGIDDDADIPDQADEAVPQPIADSIPEDPGAAVELSEAVSSEGLISVKTDSLNLRIDPKGGDIVYAALPKHLAKLNGSQTPFVLLENSAARSYIAQSGLIGPNGTDSGGKRPVFTASQTNYRLADEQNELTVELKLIADGDINIVKRYHFTRNSYVVDVSYVINNNSEQEWQASMFAQIKRDSSADPGAESGGMGMMPFLGGATTTVDEPYIKFDFEEMAEKPYKADVQGGWIAMVQHYFISAWIPNAEQQHRYATTVTGSGFNIIRYTGPRVKIAPGAQQTINTQFYAGPKDQYTLRDISEGLDLTVDYGWLWWIAQPLFWLLTKLHGIFGNWGWSIIALTFIIKLAFFRLSATSYKSMANMRRLQPKMLELRERFGDDRQKMSQATMELYKKEKINPLGGCLPILVQMPVFIALYWTLMESVELRHAPFMLWIKDLSAMDPYFVLPLIMGASMWFQQKLNPAPPDPMQAKIMQWMPIVFTFLFLWFPSGLVLYWVTNNILSIAQQWLITRQIENASTT